MKLSPPSLSIFASLALPVTCARCIRALRGAGKTGTREHAMMPPTSPLLTISALPPVTCACRIRALRGAGETGRRSVR